MKKDNPIYEREREADVDNSNMVVCGGCNGFFAKSYFWRHRKQCGVTASQTTRITSLSVQLMRSTVNTRVKDVFKQEILSKFNNDEAGKLCQLNPTLLSIGEWQYSKINKKKDKKTEVRKSVMTGMRRLALLYLTFTEVANEISKGRAMEIQEMFIRTNLNILKEAIERYTTTDSGVIKHGLKYALYYLIKNSADIIKAV